MGWVRVNTCTVLGLELDVLVGTSTSVSTGTRVLTSGASLRPIVDDRNSKTPKHQQFDRYSSLTGILSKLADIQREKEEEEEKRH